MKRLSVILFLALLLGIWSYTPSPTFTFVDQVYALAGDGDGGGDSGSDEGVDNPSDDNDDDSSDSGGVGTSGSGDQCSYNPSYCNDEIGE